MKLPNFLTVIFLIIFPDGHSGDRGVESQNSNCTPVGSTPPWRAD